MLAVHHLCLNGIRRTQQFVDLLQVARKQQIADTGGRNQFAPLPRHRHHGHRNAVPAAQPGQHWHITLPAAAKGKIVAAEHRGGIHFIDQHLLHVLFGRKLVKVLIAGAIIPVHPQCRNAAAALVGRKQCFALDLVPLAQQKGKYPALHPAALCLLNGGTQHAAVAKVHAVKIAQRHRKFLLWSLDQFLHGKALALFFCGFAALHRA
ncbi:hypothetical protein SDC9_118859 [bioreactor metagenome]|uniref:Uncharacterized protein n=1 Tax=bioreactor metagenome TaxID=1076179 RepID=A0A645C3F1_9ZZZZ